MIPALGLFIVKERCVVLPYASSSCMTLEPGTVLVRIGRKKNRTKWGRGMRTLFMLPDTKRVWATFYQLDGAERVIEEIE